MLYGLGGMAVFFLLLTSMFCFQVRHPPLSILPLLSLPFSLSPPLLYTLQSLLSLTGRLLWQDIICLSKPIPYIGVHATIFSLHVSMVHIFVHFSFHDFCPGNSTWCSTGTVQSRGSGSLCSGTWYVCVHDTVHNTMLGIIMIIACTVYTSVLIPYLLLSLSLSLCCRRYSVADGFRTLPTGGAASGRCHSNHCELARQLHSRTEFSVHIGEYGPG